MNAYIGCINRLSERSHSSRSRYFSWAEEVRPDRTKRIIYGTYTIYDVGLREERRRPTASSRMTLLEEPPRLTRKPWPSSGLLKEADDYYAENYKGRQDGQGQALRMLVAA